MDKEEALKNAKEKYERTVKKIELAEKFCKIVDPLLPAGWESEFNGSWEEVEFSKYGGSNAIEFRVVCDMLEKITGHKLSRRISGDEESQRLFAYGSYDSPDGDGRITINIVLGNPEGCKIEFERTWEIKAIVDKKCLGIREEAENV